MPRGRTRAEQRRDRVAAVEDHRLRRHRDADVLAHQRGRRLRVARLVGGDEPREQPLLVLGELGRRAARRRSGSSSRSVSRPRCSALLAAATLMSSSSAVSAADQSSTSRRITHRALAGGQQLDQRDERQLDRLARDDDRVGLAPRSARPRPAAGPGTAAATGRRPWTRAPAPGACCGAARRGRRWWRSCTATRAVGVAGVGVARAPRAQERLLERVLGLVEGPEHAVAVDVQLPPVTLEGLLEVGRHAVGHSAHALETSAHARTHRSGVARGPRSGTNALTMQELTVGATFADHEIVGIAGRGAMGVVYRARHRSTATSR